MKKTTYRVAALLICATAALTACDTTGLNNALDNFAVIIGLDPINTYATVQVTDAVTRELVETQVAVSFGGPDAAHVIDMYSDPIEQESIDGGILGFGIDNTVIPTETSPAEVEVWFSASGYYSAGKILRLTDKGDTDFEVKLVKMNNPPEGVERVEATVTTGSDNATTEELNLETAAGGTQSSTSISIPAGVAFKDENGNALEGELKVEAVNYDATNSESMSAMPYSFTSENEDELQQVLGVVMLEVTDGSGRRAVNFEGKETGSAKKKDANLYMQATGCSVFGGPAPPPPTEIGKPMKVEMKIPAIPSGGFGGSLGGGFGGGTPGNVQVLMVPISVMTQPSPPGSPKQSVSGFAQPVINCHVDPTEGLITGYIAPSAPLPGPIGGGQSLGMGGFGLYMLGAQKASGTIEIERNGWEGAVKGHYYAPGISKEFSIPSGSSVFRNPGFPSGLLIIDIESPVLFKTTHDFKDNSVANISLPPSPQGLVPESQLDFTLSCPDNTQKVRITNLKASLNYRKTGAIGKWHTSVPSFIYDEEEQALTGGNFKVYNMEPGAEYTFTTTYDGKAIKVQEVFEVDKIYHFKIPQSSADICN